MFGVLDLAGAALARAATEAAQVANSARLALSCHHQVSTGLGHSTLDTPVMFDVPFLTRPFFVEGASVREGPENRAEWGVPQGSASVYQWERNAKGHYIGAYLHLSVWIESAVGYFVDVPRVEMIHDLVFIGVGYKDLGSEVATEAQLLTPRAVGFGGIA